MNIFRVALMSLMPSVAFAGANFGPRHQELPLAEAILGKWVYNYTHKSATISAIEAGTSEYFADGSGYMEYVSEEMYLSGEQCHIKIRLDFNWAISADELTEVKTTSHVQKIIKGDCSRYANHIKNPKHNAGYTWVYALTKRTPNLLVLQQATSRSTHTKFLTRN